MSEPGFASLGPTLLARKGGAKPAMRPQVAPLVRDEAELAALADEQLEDLGWNDMGNSDGDKNDWAKNDWANESDASAQRSESRGEVVPINPALAANDAAPVPSSPIVRRQQRRLEERVQQRVLADAVMTGPEDEAEQAFDERENAADPAFDLPAEPEAMHAVPAPVQPEAPTQAPAPASASAPASAPKSERRAAFTLRLDAERHLKLRLAATMQGVSAQTLVTEALDRLLAEFDDLDIIAAHLRRH